MVTSSKPRIVIPVHPIQKSDDIHVRLLHDGSKPEGQGLNSIVSSQVDTSITTPIYRLEMEMFRSLTTHRHV